MPAAVPAALRQTVRSSVMYSLGEPSLGSPWTVTRPMCPVPVVTQICLPLESVLSSMVSVNRVSARQTSSDPTWPGSSSTRVPPVVSESRYRPVS